MERQKMINELFHEHPIPSCPQSILGWDGLGNYALIDFLWLIITMY